MALNRTEIISVVLNRLGNRGNDTVLTAAAKTELNLVVSELEAEPFLPWFLLSAESTIGTIVDGSSDVTLPSDFIREYEDEDVWYYNAANSPTKKKLEKCDIDDLTEWNRTADADEPNQYSLVGSSFILGPVPNATAATGSIKTRYFARATSLSDAVLTNVWTLNADWVLINRLGEVMARQYVRDLPLAEEFAKKAGQSFLKLQAAHVAREQANRRAQMGGSDR